MGKMILFGVICGLIVMLLYDVQTNITSPTMFMFGFMIGCLLGIGSIISKKNNRKEQ